MHTNSLHSNTARLSIVIVSYHSNDVLPECLQSIDFYNPLQQLLQVIVVDNAASPELASLLQSRTYNFQLQYVANSSNNGFGGGNNLGVLHAQAPYLLFLNPDTRLCEDVFTPTLQLLDADDHHVIGYSLTDPAGQRNDTYSFYPEYIYIFPLLHLLSRISFLGCVNHIACVNRIAWPWGAAFAVSKTQFEQAGGFDERIFLCNEEPDLMKRMPEHRLRILPQRIIHLEGHGRPVSQARYLAFLQSTDYYLLKHNIPLRRLYWTWVKLKLSLKRLLHLSVDPNYVVAFHQFEYSDHCNKQS